MIEFYHIPEITKIVENIHNSLSWSAIKNLVKMQADRYPFNISRCQYLNLHKEQTIQILKKYGIECDSTNTLIGHSMSPHVDMVYYNKYYFLNVAVQAHHDFGYNMSKNKLNHVTVHTGDIFLIDQSKPHWFVPYNEPFDLSKLEPFILFNLPIKRKHREYLKPFFINNGENL